MMRITPMVKNILIINLIIFAFQSIFHWPFSNIFGLRVIFADDFRPFQLFTYMWIHGGIGHIFGNMLLIFFLGPMLESEWGSKRFLTFYLVCGIGAGVFYGAADYAEKHSLKNEVENYSANPNPEDFRIFILDYRIGYEPADLGKFSDDFFERPNDAYYISQSIQLVNNYLGKVASIPMVGASGAMYGILMALFLLFPNKELYIYMMFPVKIKYMVFLLTVYEIYSEFHRQPGDNVAHLAHLGGMLIAFGLIKYWQNNSQRFN